MVGDLLGTFRAFLTQYDGSLRAGPGALQVWELQGIVADGARYVLQVIQQVSVERAAQHGEPKAGSWAVRLPWDVHHRRGGGTLGCLHTSAHWMHHLLMDTQ